MNHCLYTSNLYTINWLYHNKKNASITLQIYVYAIIEVLNHPPYDIKPQLQTRFLLLWNSSYSWISLQPVPVNCAKNKGYKKESQDVPNMIIEIKLRYH